MKQVTVEQARQTLPDLVDAAAHGEDVVLVPAHGPHVRLVPFTPAPTAAPRFGSARGQITMADDFDALLPDFDDYTK